jgi:hypothetical protein
MTKRKKSIMKKAVVGVITTTIAIQLTPINVSAIEEIDNKNQEKYIELRKEDTDEVDENLDLENYINISFNDKANYYYGNAFKIGINIKPDNLVNIKKGTTIRFKIPNLAIDYNSLKVAILPDFIELKKDIENNNVDLIFKKDVKDVSLLDMKLIGQITWNPGNYTINADLINPNGDSENINLENNNFTVYQTPQCKTPFVNPYWIGKNFIGTGILGDGIHGGIYESPSKPLQFKAKYNGGKEKKGPYNNVDINIKLEGGQALTKGSIRLVNKSGKDITNTMQIVTSSDEFTIKTGNVNKDTVFDIYFSTQVQKKGIYKTIFTAITDTGYKSEFTLNSGFMNDIIIGWMPKIKGADNISIKEGTPFNPMKGVSATDKEDGNITKDIKVTGTVDIDKPGKYELIYTVTDKDKNTTNVIRTVTVNPKMIDINAIPVINASDKTIKVGDKFNPLEEVSVSDKEDGNITKDIKVIENTLDTSKEGVYKVVYKVTDNQGATVTKTITVIVRSNDKPVISGADNISIKEGMPFNPIKGVSAADKEDGNITKDIKVTGIVDIDKPGKYELIYTVTDKDKNTTNVIRTVIVNPKMIDINTIPVINVSDKTIKVGDKFNPLEGVSATDKEDGDLTKDIKVIENTLDTSKEGVYKVVYKVTDKQCATVTKTIAVTVKSNDKPVISGADNISIKEGTQFNPIKGVSATDKEDGNITKDIKIAGTVDVDNPEKYELTYTVTDKDKNTTNAIRTVTVKNKMIEINAIPVINASDKTIKVGDKFNPLEEVSVSDKEDRNLTKDIKVIENTVNTSKAGIYKVVYEVTDKKGATSTKPIKVTVVKKSKNLMITTGESKITII